MLKIKYFFLHQTKTLRRWLRWWDRFNTRHKYKIYLVIVILVTIGCLLKPPFHVLSQNFIYLIQIVSTVLAVELGFLSSRRVNSSHYVPLRNIQKTSTAMRKDAVFLCGLVSIPYLTIILSSYFVKGCQVFDGSIAFWVSVVPSFLAGLVWGYSVGMFTKKWRFFWLITIGGAILVGAYEGANAYFGSHGNFPYLILGNVPSQRSDVLPNSFHLYSRMFLLATTVLLYEWATLLYLLKHLRRDVTLLRVARTLLLTIGLLVVGYLTQGETGLGWSYRRINRVLSQQKEIENIRLHYAPDHAIEPHTWRKLEWGIYKLAQRMQVSHETGDIVEVYVFPSHDELKKYTNGVAHAYAKSGKFYMTQWSLGSNTFAHELAHIFHRQYARSWKLKMRRAFIEGTAMAFTEGLTLSPEHHEGVAILEQEGTLPSMEDFYKDLLFVHHPESLAYDACGSFVGFLVLEYGVEKYKELNATMHFENTYGYSLEELNMQWKSFLQAIPVEYVYKKHVSQWYAKQEAYTSQCCPQVGEQQDSPAVQADFLSWWLDPPGAKTIYAELRELHPEALDWQLKYIKALITNNERSAATDELEELLNRRQEDESARYDVYHLQFFLHALNHDPDGAVASLQQMLAISEDSENWQALRLQLLQHPTIGPAYLKAIVLDWKERRTHLMDLHQRDLEFGPAYIYAFHFTNIYPDATIKRRFLEEFINKTSGFPPLKVQAFKDFLKECLKYQYYDDAEDVLARFDDMPFSNKDRAEILEITERLKFEQQHFPDASAFFPYHPSHLSEVGRTNRIW